MSINNDEVAPFLVNSRSTYDSGIESGLSQRDLTSKAKYKPVGWCYKISVLMCISFIAFGGLFVYDSVSALEVELTTDLSLSKSLYGLLFSVYALPNIVLVIVGGFITDKIGNRKSGLLFGVLFLFGSILSALGPSLKRWFGVDSFAAYIVMLVGQFIFGVGAESAYVVQNSMCVAWFEGKHLSIAMGVTDTIAHLGSVVSFNVDEAVALFMKDYIYALWFAATTALFSFFAIVLYVILDLRAKNRRKPQADQAEELERANITFKDIRHFSRRYWIAVLIVLCAENAVYAYRTEASEFIEKKWQYDESEANFFVSVIDITAMICSPLLGLVVDLTGKHGWGVIAGNVLGVLGFGLMGLTTAPPVIGSICIGLQYSFINAALYPSVAFLITDNFEGTAYSIIAAIINLTGTGIYPLAGWIADNYDFTVLCMFFVGLSAIAAITSVVWNILDYTRELASNLCLIGPSEITEIKRDTPMP